MHNNKESPFSLTLLEGDLHLQVLQFSGHEALNQPYRFEIEVIALAPTINLGQLLHQQVFLDLGNGNGIHGIIHCATGEHRGLCRIASVTVVPLLQALDQGRVRRVFHHLGVPDILLQLLTEHGLPTSSFRLELQGQYPPRPFTIQYEENDLILLQRLCEEEGIHFHFEHSREGHVLVLADDSLSLPQAPVLMPFRPVTDPHCQLPKISQLYQRHNARSWPPRPDARDRSTAVSAESAANHAFASAPATPEAQRSLRQLERLRCLSRQVQGRSNQSTLRSAHIVQVAEHPVPEFNDQWLLIDIRHQGRQTSILAQDSDVSEYHNEFTAIPWSTVFRPSLDQPRPNIAAPQPARVVGESGKPATLDDQGRIQVWLWPQSTADAEYGIRVPVACTTANQHPDTLPVAGSEVGISFLDGDPDRPIFCASGLESQQSRSAARPGTHTGLLLDWLLEI
ncbi:type VI secretion system Vgr family protein [Pseudomonas sp. LB3P31]